MAGKIDGSFFVGEAMPQFDGREASREGLSSSPGCQSHSTLQHP